MTTGEYYRELRRISAESYETVQTNPQSDRQLVLQETADEAIRSSRELEAYFRLRGFSGEDAADQMMRDALFLERSKSVL